LPDRITAIQAVLLDVEGTTTPIAFVRDVLFPFARARLPDLLGTRAGDPAVAAELAAVRYAAPGQDPLAALLGWMDVDAKATPLKALQGLVWREGYESGALHGAMYPDVAPCLQRWRERGLRLFIYSSGSTEAQRLIFGHSSDGDLTGLLDGYFDTRVGPKRDQASYGAITGSIGLPPDAVLFLSDVEAELDAAAAAGLATGQLVRAADGTVASDRHPTAAIFPDIERRFGLS
jgi:enolase-phosphatase E1